MIETASDALKPFHEGLLKIWSENSDNPFTRIVPMVYTGFKPESLLFIGINHSFDPKAVVRVVKNTVFEEKLKNVSAVNEYFKFDKRAESKLADLQFIQQCHKDKLAYYSRHRLLSKALDDICWEHIDLFQVRHSIQKDVTDCFIKKSDTSFFEQQISLFMQLLVTISPKVIVVLNRASGTILKEVFAKIDPGLLTETGKNQFVLNFNGKRIPLFMSVHIRYKTADERNQINQEIVDFVKGVGDI